jgi:hypothetical protein
VCVSGIYFCYLYYGVLQEDLLTSQYGPEKKSFKDACSLLFLMAVQCSIGAILSRVACFTAAQPATGWQSVQDFQGFQGRLWPLYMQVGFCYVLAMLLSNGALSFINYPTQVHLVHLSVCTSYFDSAPCQISALQGMAPRASGLSRSRRGR